FSVEGWGKMTFQYCVRSGTPDAKGKLKKSREPAHDAFQIVRLRTQRRHRMIGRSAATFENLQRPTCLRRLVSQQIVQHLPFDQAGAAAHRQDAVLLQQLERLQKQSAVAAQGFLNSGFAASELRRIEYDDAEAILRLDQLIEPIE